MIPTIIFLTTFAYVAFKAAQQLNVVQYKWMLVPVFSYGMAYMEYGSIGIGVIDVMNNGYWRILLNGFCAGTGGWLGSWTAMYLHKRLVSNG